MTTWRGVENCRGWQSDRGCRRTVGDFGRVLNRFMIRKWHIKTDTQGFLVGPVVHAADTQDRDGAAYVLSAIRHPPSLSMVAACLRRRRLCGKEIESSARQNRHLDGADRQAHRQCQKAPLSFPGAGLSSGPSLGSVVTVASPKTSNVQSRVQPHGSSWLPYR